MSLEHNQNRLTIISNTDARDTNHPKTATGPFRVGKTTPQGVRAQIALVFMDGFQNFRLGPFLIFWEEEQEDQLHIEAIFTMRNDRFMILGEKGFDESAQPAALDSKSASSGRRLRKRGHGGFHPNQQREREDPTRWPTHQGRDFRRPCGSNQPQRNFVCPHNPRHRAEHRRL
jgi:hypothetical protein